MEVLGIFILFMVIAFIKNAAEAEKKKQKTDTTAPKEKKPTVEIPKTKPQPKPAAKTTERKYYDSTCMQESTRHDHNRRMEQLSDFLKSGIIDREEYNILKERYENI